MHGEAVETTNIHVYFAAHSPERFGRQSTEQLGEAADNGCFLQALYWLKSLLEGKGSNNKRMLGIRNLLAPKSRGVSGEQACNGLW